MPRQDKIFKSVEHVSYLYRVFIVLLLIDAVTRMDGKEYYITIKNIMVIPFWHVILCYCIFSVFVIYCCSRFLDKKLIIKADGIYFPHISLMIPWDEINGVSHISVNQKWGAVPGKTEKGQGSLSICAHSAKL